MKYLRMVIVVLSGLSAGYAAAAEPTALERGMQTRPVQLSRLVAKLSRGEAIGRYTPGRLCLTGHERMTWRTGGLQELNLNEFDEVFRNELTKLGFQVAGDPQNLFESDGGRAEYLVGGTISKINLDLCFPQASFDNWDVSKGTASVEVGWQIYSQLDRKVVGTIVTSGQFDQRKSQNGGMYAVLLKAFADSVRQLAASGQFRSIFVGTPADLTVARRSPTNLAPLDFAAATSPHSSLNDAVGSTVLILSGTGHGSGFLISQDGLVVTNAHVAGAAKYLKIRWSDGVETLGEVARIDKARDVALIKTDARNRRPFLIRRTPATVGEDVYAIGAPLDTSLQSSVSKGIVSANRVIDGLSYIQSDVTVNPGNSGGPLLDAKRNLLGMTVSAISKDGVSRGVNLFIPIGDATDFLGIVPRDAGNQISASGSTGQSRGAVGKPR